MSELIEMSEAKFIYIFYTNDKIMKSIRYIHSIDSLCIYLFNKD